MRKDQYLKFFRSQVKAMGHTSLSTMSNAEKIQLTKVLQTCVSANRAGPKLSAEVKSVLYELSTKDKSKDYISRRLREISAALGGQTEKNNISDLLNKLKTLTNRLQLSAMPVKTKALKIEIEDTVSKLNSNLYSLIIDSGIDDSKKDVERMLNTSVLKLL